jgi:hypothetical protein
MFGIRWLNGSSIVATEMSALDDLRAVIASALSRAQDVRRRHPGNEPDNFIVADDLGEDQVRVVIEPEPD